MLPSSFFFHVPCLFFFSFPFTMPPSFVIVVVLCVRRPIQRAGRMDGADVCRCAWSRGLCAAAHWSRRRQGYQKQCVCRWPPSCFDFPCPCFIFYFHQYIFSLAFASASLSSLFTLVVQKGLVLFAQYPNTFYIPPGIISYFYCWLELYFSFLFLPYIEILRAQRGSTALALALANGHSAIVALLTAP